MIFGNGFQSVRIQAEYTTQSTLQTARNSFFRGNTVRPGVFSIEVVGGGGGGGGRWVQSGSNRPGEAGQNAVPVSMDDFLAAFLGAPTTEMGTGGVGGNGGTSENTAGTSGTRTRVLRAINLTSEGGEGGRKGADAIGLNYIPQGAPSSFPGRGGYGGWTSGAWINNNGQDGVGGQIKLTRLA